MTLSHAQRPIAQKNKSVHRAKIHRRGYPVGKLLKQRTVPLNAEQKSGLRLQLVIVVVTALLSFLGAMGGSLVSQQFELTKMNREAATSYNREVIQRRGQLLEETIRVANKGLASSIHSAALEHAKVAALSKAAKDNQESLTTLEKS
jgi:hypothetical protein